MRLYILLCSLFFIIISNVIYAASPTTETTLPNGLKVIIKEDHRVPVVVTEVWYKVGSSYEPNGITGISHALEHMMFKGTPTHGPGEFSKIIAENGGEENAFTSSDYTAYYQMMEVQKLPISLQLEADRMRNLLVQPKEFVKEIEVVKEERRLRTEDSPQNYAYEKFAAAANVASPYHHPVIGWMWDLNNMTAIDVKKWYQTWYAPNNAVLVIVGDVKPLETIALVKKYFGPLKPSTLAPTKQPGEIQNFGGRRIVVKTPAKLPLLIMGYNTPVLKTANPKSDAYALAVLAGILDEGDSSRLTKNLVRGKQLAAEINANYDIFSRLDDVFTIVAIPSQGHSSVELENSILQQVKALQDNVVDSKELARVKAQIIANQTFEKDSYMNQATEIGSLEAVNLSWREADNYVNKINEVTAEQVQAVARKYLVSTRLTIANLIPLPLKPNQKDQPNLNMGGQNVR